MDNCSRDDSNSYQMRDRYTKKDNTSPEINGNRPSSYIDESLGYILIIGIIIFFAAIYDSIYKRFLVKIAFFAIIAFTFVATTIEPKTSNEGILEG